ncbi:MAG: hypothetical protein KA712_02590 [Myxococcales bacterium]|nr:hypothetical protein [Myxococcales bacterium]
MTAPDIPSTPSLLFAQAKVFGLMSAFVKLQAAVSHLTRKARTRAPFREDEKEFLVELFECFSLGGRAVGYSEAAQLSRHYVHGNGKTLRISSEVYEESVIVRDVQAVMKRQIVDDLKKNKGAVALSSADARLAKLPGFHALSSRTRNQDTHGRVLPGGWLFTEQSNQRLQKANNRFQLQSVSQGSGSLVSTTWRVDDEYLFEGFDKDFVTNIPIRENMILLMPDGLSAYMTTLRIAKAFKHYAEWKEEWQPSEKSVSPRPPRRPSPPGSGANAH